MRNVVKAALVALVLAFAGPAAAHHSGAGLEAYQRGDYTTALREWRVLAEQGNAEAQNRLGIMYLLSQGVPQDLVQAHLWLSLATRQGHQTAYIINDDVAAFMTPEQIAEAQVSLAVMYEEGRGVAQDDAAAEKWARLAAEQGSAKAQDILGFMYFDGRGVTLDYVQAYMLWSLSVGQGQKRAAGARDVVASMMAPEQIAEARNLAREWKPK